MRSPFLAGVLALIAAAFLSASPVFAQQGGAQQGGAQQAGAQQDHDYFRDITTEDICDLFYATREGVFSLRFYNDETGETGCTLAEIGERGMISMHIIYRSQHYIDQGVEKGDWLGRFVWTQYENVLAHDIWMFGGDCGMWIKGGTLIVRPQSATMWSVERNDTICTIPQVTQAPACRIFGCAETSPPGPEDAGFFKGREAAIAWFRKTFNE